MSILLSGGSIVLSGSSIVLTNSSCPTCCSSPCFMGATEDSTIAASNVSGVLDYFRAGTGSCPCDSLPRLHSVTSTNAGSGPTGVSCSPFLTATLNTVPTDTYDIYFPLGCSPGITSSGGGLLGFSVFYECQCDSDTPIHELTLTLVVAGPGGTSFTAYLHHNLLTGVTTLDPSAWSFGGVAPTSTSGTLAISGAGTPTLVIDFTVSADRIVTEGGCPSFVTHEADFSGTVTLDNLEFCEPVGSDGFDCFSSPTPSPFPPPTQPFVAQPSAASLRSSRGCGCQKVRTLRA